jgi:hypothetical protein
MPCRNEAETIARCIEKSKVGFQPVAFAFYTKVFATPKVCCPKTRS